MLCLCPHYTHTDTNTDWAFGDHVVREYSMCLCVSVFVYVCNIAREAN